MSRERIVNPLVRHVSPALKWHAISDDWNLLGFECAPGKHADYSPGSPDIPKVMETLLLLQDVTCPGRIDVKRAEARWARYTTTPELLAGTSLLHTEWTPGNVLVADRARLVDWAWPTRGGSVDRSRVPGRLADRRRPLPGLRRGLGRPDPLMERRTPSCPGRVRPCPGPPVGRYRRRFRPGVD